jgi:hypothetical protein
MQVTVGPSTASFSSYSSCLANLGIFQGKDKTMDFPERLSPIG